MWKYSMSYHEIVEGIWANLTWRRDNLGWGRTNVIKNVKDQPVEAGLELLSITSNTHTLEPISRNNRGIDLGSIKGRHL